MSGICGIVSLVEHSPRLDLLERMMQSLSRLGADGGGTWHDDAAALGQRMMWITPESRHERLPLYDAESGIAVTADVRLDNRDDLLRELQLPSARDAPDSELVLAAYQKWGAGCADHLVGDFALAIWDARSQQLHCITDPMGIRPLFYTEVGGQSFVFASEVSALLGLSGRPAVINQRRLAMLGVSALSVYLEPETTCFEHIYRVAAGSVLSVRRQGKRTHRYWSPDPRRRIAFASEEECAEAFRAVLSGAVKARLRSAYPVASLLSGGLDSSAIVSTAGQALAGRGERLVTLSTTPMPAAIGRVADERRYIDMYRGDETLEMHDVAAPAGGPFDRLEDLVETGALCSYSYQHFLYTALVGAARAGGARVILDGDGGELSASVTPQGYLAELLIRGRWPTLLRELSHLSVGRSGRWPVVKQQVVRPLVPYRILKAVKRQQRFSTLLAYPVQAGFVRDILGDEVESIIEQMDRLPAEYPDHRKNSAADIRLERNDIRQRSHAGFVAYEQARFTYPFLDRRVLEFALAVDGRFKQKEGRGRRLLRSAMQGLVPGEILARTDKVPFCPDYHLRYQRARPTAAERLKAFAGAAELNKIIDFGTVFQALETTPGYREINPMRVDYDSQFVVPYAVYLCYFLSRFGT